MAEARRFTPESEAQYDASDPKQIKKAEAAAKLRDEERRAFFALFLSKPQYREWIWQVLKDCHTFEERLPVSGSLYETGFWNGQRDRGLALMRVFAAASPENFGHMLKEQNGG